MPIFLQEKKLLNKTIVDTRILHENIQKLKATIPENAKYAAVVKGDAYGHGLKLVTRILDEEECIDMFVVASFREALYLYREDIKKPTLLLGRESARVVEEELRNLDEEKRRLLMEKITFSAYSGSGLKDFERLCKYGEVKVHLRLDFESGLKGFDRDDFEANRFRLEEDKEEYKVRITGLYAHIYAAYSGDDDRTAREIRGYEEVFDSLKEEVRDRLTIHLHSSALCYRFPENSFDMARIGALMYGIGRRRDENEPDVKEVLSIIGTVLKIKEIEPDSTIDYSGKLPDSVKKVALMSFGSWDLPFFLTAKDPVVEIRGRLFYIVGEPCMDTCLVDITGADDICEFDRAQVIGDFPGIRFDDWVERSSLDFGNCQTLFAGIGRIPKYYIDSEGNLKSADDMARDKVGGIA